MSQSARRKPPTRASAGPPDSPRPGPRQERLQREPNKLLRGLKLLGPGLITGAADDDPSGIGTYSIAGAALGYPLLWVGVYSIPLMVAIQMLSSRIGLVTGEGLGATLKRHYSRWVLYPVVLGLVASNVITVGADLHAIGEALRLMVPLPPLVGAIAAAIALMGVLTFGGYRLIDRYLKWLAVVFLAYVGAGFLAHPQWDQVLRGTFVPTISTDSTFLSNLVALLGATGSPYLLFWQARQEVEEEVEMGRKDRRQRLGTTSKELRYGMWDVIAGMVFSQVIAYFVQLATAATLHNAGKQVQSASDAAQALRPLAGDAASILFSIGLIATGCLAIPVLAGSAAFAVSATFGWRSGLSQPATRARRFYGALGAVLLVGLGMNLAGLDSFQALFFASLIFGLLTPPLILIILLIANNRRIMGDRVAGRWLNALGIVTLLTNTAGAVGFLLTLRG